MHEVRSVAAIQVFSPRRRESWRKYLKLKCDPLRRARLSDHRLPLSMVQDGRSNDLLAPIQTLYRVASFVGLIPSPRPCLSRRSLAESSKTAS